MGCLYDDHGIADNGFHVLFQLYGGEALKAVKWTITTLLAWLGLAGLADDLLPQLIAWQDWFDQGVMEHWRSIKEWLIAIVFDGLPFRLPSWVIDYIVIGGVVSRTMLQVISHERIERFAKDTNRNLGSEFPWFTRNIIRPISFMIVWPILLPLIPMNLVMSDEYQEKKMFSKKDAVTACQLLALAMVGFIPFLFVTSTVLYKYG